MKAFANGRRILIMRYIRKSKEASVTEIAKEIRLSFRATSKHLSILSGANVLEKEQRGLQIFYRVASNLSSPAVKILSLV